MILLYFLLSMLGGAHPLPSPEEEPLLVILWAETFPYHFLCIFAVSTLELKGWSCTHTHCG